MKFSIREPTRPCSGTCCDNIIHNIRGSKGEVYEFAVSDHTAQILKCPVKRICKLKFWYSTKRDYSEENMVKFRNYLGKLHFTDTYTSSDPNDAFNSFFDIFVLLYDLCFPTIKIKNTTRKKPKWLSKGIKNVVNAVGICFGNTG